jgi:bifunctional DNA-binding transcriptional regulator/antitoxin component of YhaV-PrlF toxin-antitoxin module
VTLPAEVVEAFGLKKGQEVDVAVHPATGAVVIRPGVKYFEDGKVTRRFRTLADSVLGRYDKAFEELAK